MRIVVQARSHGKANCPQPCDETPNPVMLLFLSLPFPPRHAIIGALTEEKPRGQQSVIIGLENLRP